MEDLVKLTELYRHESAEVFLQHCYPDFANIVTLSDGFSFGEVALRQNVPRKNTILCKTGTHFAFVNKKIFNDCMNQYFQQTRDEEINFLKSFPIFENVLKSDIEILLLIT